MTIKPITKPNFDNLINECQKYIDAMPTDAAFSNQLIFEAAIEAVFGEEAWTWIMDHKLAAKWEAIKDVPIRRTWLENTDDKNELITPAAFLKERRTASSSPKNGG